MKLTKHKGQYIISNPKLSLANEMLLDSGGSLAVSLKLHDKRHMSDQQRKFIFALCREVEYETGIDLNQFRASMMSVLNSMYDEKLSSLTQYSMTDANRLIDIIIIFMIDKEIAISYDLIKNQDFRFNQSHVYQMCLKRICNVCGQRAELHHVDTVGIGRDRNKISHIGMRMLPLCREHHNEAHTIGDKAFLERYHLEPIKIDKTLEHFIKTGKIRVFD